MTLLTESDAVALATLSPTEREVLVLAAKGLTIREISAHVGCRALTVNDHMKAIYAKLDVSTRVEAAVIAAKAGWV